MQARKGTRIFHNIIVLKMSPTGNPKKLVRFYFNGKTLYDLSKLDNMKKKLETKHSREYETPIKDHFNAKKNRHIKYKILTFDVKFVAVGEVMEKAPQNKRKMMNCWRLFASNYMGVTKLKISIYGKINLYCLTTLCTKYCLGASVKDWKFTSATLLMTNS